MFCMKEAEGVSSPVCGPAAAPVAARRGRTPSADVERELLAAAEAVLVRQGPGGDQLAGVLGKGRADREQREQRQPELQQPPPAEPVAEVAAEQQQPGEGEGVAVDHPLQVAGRGVQVAAD